MKLLLELPLGLNSCFSWLISYVNNVVAAFATLESLMHVMKHTIEIAAFVQVLIRHVTIPSCLWFCVVGGCIMVQLVTMNSLWVFSISDSNVWIYYFRPQLKFFVILFYNNGNKPSSYKKLWWNEKNIVDRLQSLYLWSTIASTYMCSTLSCTVHLFFSWNLIRCVLLCCFVKNKIINKKALNPQLHLLQLYSNIQTRNS